MLVLRARIVAVLAVIALMLPSGAVARAHYFCKMMERVMPACCCAGEHTSEAAASAKASAPSCCERLLAPNRASASAAASSLPDVPAAALASVLPDFTRQGDPALVVGVRRPQARAPPGVGPPLFVSYCALLI